MGPSVKGMMADDKETLNPGPWLKIMPIVLGSMPKPAEIDARSDQDMLKISCNLTSCGILFTAGC
jgi:hypothetical protein